MHTTHADIDLDLVVLDKAEVAQGVCELGLGRTDGSELPAWAPGAHVDLHVGGQVRQFSLCGDPGDARRWATAVYRELDSRGGSAYVHEQLRVGETLAARGPRNNFGLVDAPAYEFVIGGIGVTPLLPMIAEVAARGVDYRVTYGGRTRAAMAYASGSPPRTATGCGSCRTTSTGCSRSRRSSPRPRSPARRCTAAGPSR